MKVLKFGGTSVADATNIKKVVSIVLKAKEKHRNVVVVVSALGGVTDDLIKLYELAVGGKVRYKTLLKAIITRHNETIENLVKKENQDKILKEAQKKYSELEKVLKQSFVRQKHSPRSLDTVMSFGEQLSSYIVCEAIKATRNECQLVDARRLIKTDANFGNANVDIEKTYKLVSKYYKKNYPLSIMGGFVATDSKGATTTLGRGGSDYTASLVGAALGAKVIEIWTDVDGVMTADPRIVKGAFPLSDLSYEEAGELAYFGAKILYSKTMQPARIGNIPIQIKNTFNPKEEGTRISSKKAKSDFSIQATSLLSDVSLLYIRSNSKESITRVASLLFYALVKANIEVLLSTQASHEESLSVVVNSRQADMAKRIIEEKFDLKLQNGKMLPILVKNHLSVVAVVGEQMKNVPGTAGVFFDTLGDNNINVVAIAQGSAEINISAVINKTDEVKALQVVHRAFFKEKVLNLFLIGTGLIGSTLLKQIKMGGLPIHITGLSNSRSMLLDRQGIGLQDWEQKLDHGEPMNLENFVKSMISMNFSRSIFIDCTASERIVTLYERIMNAGIAIITPNKKANSGPYLTYQKLKKITKKNHVPFIYETNVGAGLPIIHTVQNLIASGDEVIEIEAVLSGTLSYIFNTFTESNKSFSSIVKDAQKMGYTEPDPRNDLDGTDFARKILILAREIGIKMDLKQVSVEQLLSAKCIKASSVLEFFVALKKEDDSFEKRKLKAQRKNKRLCYIATLKDSKASISLKEIDSSHPFFSLSGSDNVVLLKTKYYNKTPLVIRGPGAGAEVTAGGVLANVIRILK